MKIVKTKNREGHLAMSHIGVVNALYVIDIRFVSLKV
jgi:hypothetical protein